MKFLKSAFIALTLMAGMAHADGLTSSYVEPEILAPEPDRDFYVGIFAGTTTGDTLGTFEYPKHRLTEAVTFDLDGGTTYGAFAGWRGLNVGENLSFGVEIAHTQFGLSGGYGFHDDCYPGEASIHSATDLKIMAFYQAGENLDLFAGAGLSRGEASLSLIGVNSSGNVVPGIGGYSDHSVNGYVAQIGAEYSLSDRSSLRFDVTHHMFDGFSMADIPSGGGTSSLTAGNTDLTTFSIGLVFDI